MHLYDVKYSANFKLKTNASGISFIKTFVCKFSVDLPVGEILQPHYSILANFPFPYSLWKTFDCFQYFGMTFLWPKFIPAWPFEIDSRDDANTIQFPLKILTKWSSFRVTCVADNFSFRQAENLSFTSRRRQTLVFVFRRQLPMPCSQTSQVKIFTTTCQWFQPKKCTGILFHHFLDAQASLDFKLSHSQ